jgi:hypothetical protein
MCRILGIRIPDSRITTHYVPLSRRNHPVQTGGWLTAVVRWHMRYLLRWISRQRHDRVSELCLISFDLRVAQSLAAVVHGELCIVWCARAPVARRLHPPTNQTPSPTNKPNAFAHPLKHRTLSMPGLILLYQRTPRVIQIWMTRVLVGAGDDLARQGQVFVGDRSARAYAMLGQVMTGLWDAAGHRDALRFASVVRQMALIWGEILLLHLLSHLLEGARRAWTAWFLGAIATAEGQ